MGILAFCHQQGKLAIGTLVNFALKEAYITFVQKQ